MVDRLGDLSVGDIFRREVFHGEDDGTTSEQLLVTDVPRVPVTHHKKDQETSVTDQPPSTARIWPVIIRD